MYDFIYNFKIALPMVSLITFKMIHSLILAVSSNSYPSEPYISVEIIIINFHIDRNQWTHKKDFVNKRKRRRNTK